MERLFAAVQAGDVDRVSALVREAAVAGQAEMVENLLMSGADPNRAWPGGVEPVSWFAERGAWNMLLTVLIHNDDPSWWPTVPESSLRTALGLARAWLAVDPERELCRRLDTLDNPATVVQRELVPAWRDGDDGPMATRIRVRAADGRQDQVWAAHRAVVTLLEDELGIVTSNEEIAERAVHTADPDSWDDAQAHTTIRERAERDAEVFYWLATRLTHPGVEHRRFAARIMYGLCFRKRPFDDAQAADILAGRIRDEPDPAVLETLIGAFAEFTLRAQPVSDLREILPYARHHDPSVRARVAMEFVVATGSWRYPTLRDPASPALPEVITALIELAADPDPDTRAAALGVLAGSYLDTARVHTILTDRLHDPHPPARIQAAVGLAFRDDPRGREALHRLQTDPATADLASNQLANLDRILAWRAQQQ
jgi:hypothetical protein